MNGKISLSAILLVLFLASASFAQRTEVALTVGEQFFDALLDATFKHYDAPEFSIAAGQNEEPSSDGLIAASSLFGYASRMISGPSESDTTLCGSVKVLREGNGVRTSVRFRDGVIQVPLAFSGSYAAPFIGCVEFDGVADSIVDLEYDFQNRRLIGTVRVQNVNLNGTGGLGGIVIARLIQSSIDKKLNPVEILTLDKVSFGLPIPNTGKLQMNAVGVRPEIFNGSIQMRITYEFVKG